MFWEEITITCNNINNNRLEYFFSNKYQFFITFSNGLNNLKE